MSVELDKSQEWRDARGRLWWWSYRNGWVIDGKATFGGFWPTERDWPFTLACRHVNAVSQGNPPVVTCTECGADDGLITVVYASDSQPSWAVIDWGREAKPA